MGLRPSVAENQYLQDLDALIASQSAATAGVRGQDSALAQQAAARQAAAIGQKAVRETAGLRLQEQQAAEQAYAAQAQGLMIEDQKVASQEKTNELQQAMQVTQANLENARTALTKDSFNAEAINRVNQLNAQYQNQASQLNAQLQNTVNLSNMEQQNNVSLQNAMRALDAAKYAGSAAQAAFQSQIGLDRSDLLSQYGFGKDVTSARTETLGTVAAGLNTMVGTQLQEQEMKNVMDRWNLSRVDIQRAQEAARRLGATRAVLKAAGPGGLLMVKVAEAAGVAPDAMNDIVDFLA
jgi:myosin heavy subunit